MAFYSGNMTAAAGQLVAILSVNLPLNAYWSEYDDLGGNVVVYENKDVARNSVFYVRVDDSNADYAVIQLWEGWDAIGHAGTGQSLTTASGGARTLYIIKSLGGYGLRVRDHNFVFINFVAPYANYCGQLNRYDESKNMPILICHNSYSTAPSSNPLGRRNYDIAAATNSSWRMLFDHVGNLGTLLPQHDPNPGTEGILTNTSGLYTRTSAPAGAQYISETKCFVFGSLAVGTLEGVVYTGQTGDSMTMVDGETCDVDGVVWQMIKSSTGPSGSIIELA